MAGQRLVLWDVDRTLLWIDGVSRLVYAEAFEAVTGQPMRRLADLAGRTDHYIVRTTLRLHGMSDGADLLGPFFAALVRGVRARRDLLAERGRPLPGAAAALGAVAGLPGAVQTVVTGNLPEIAAEKLAAVGLLTHLDLEIGGFGSDGGDRHLLVGLAVDRAERKLGWRCPPERVVVVGDTVHDIAGARACGVRAVGVASGGTPAADLWAAGADAVLPDLADTAAVLAAVTAVPGPAGNGEVVTS